MIATEWLAADPMVPQRDALLDVDKMRRQLAGLLGDSGIATPVVERTTYRVGHSLRVAYRTRTSNGIERLVTARTNSAAVRFWVFPRDRHLTQIDALLGPSPALVRELALARALGDDWASSRVVGYAPGKSVVVACLGGGGEPIAYAKQYASADEAVGAYALHRAVWQASLRRASSSIGGAALRIPQPLACGESHQVVVSEAARGTRLTDLAPSQFAEAVGMLGAATARFHGLTVAAGIAPRSTRGGDAALRQAAELIGRAWPSQAPTVASIVADLIASRQPREAERGDDVVLHGDLHFKNALVDGDDVWLIDHDQVAIGPAAADIGSFLALLRSRAIGGALSWPECERLERLFLDGYAGVRPLPSPSVIDWYTAAALLSERALRAISRVRVPMLRKLDAIVADAHHVLHRGEAR